MSKLKTVFDAVNELRGDLNNAARADTQTYLKFSLVTHTWLCSASSIANHSYEDVCTIAEFNALVEDMQLGLDINSVTHSELYNYVNADKTPLEKESIVNKPLVYTQEMADNGILPSVGSEVLYYVSYKPAVSDDNHKHHGEIMDVVCHNDGLVVLLSKNKLFATACNDEWIRPIDQRTKKEKAIDEIESELSKIAYSTRSALELAYDEWVGE